MIFAIEEQHRFRLDESFRAQFRGKEPRWGFNGLGHVVFLRTYARPVEGEDRLETFEECLARVVEGAFSILWEHLARQGRSFEPARAQRKAQEMFRRAWEFKWLPPGRSLWLMGTRAVEERGSVALNNCAFKSTKDIAKDFADPFCVAMDFLMLGVGVGFDVRGAGTIRITAPTMTSKNDVHVVEDTREGWVNALRRVLNAFTTEFGSLPERFDTSKVRPRGTPLKTFGGTASGPKPLHELLRTVTRLLRERVGTVVDSTLIVDIMNLIGRCVVAGNVRRSSELALGDANDPHFRSLKDPSLLQGIRDQMQALASTDPERTRLANQEREHPLNAWRWASNNSLLVGPATNFAPLAEQTVRNGEPGYVWMDTVRAFGRTSDAPTWDDRDALGTNPCGEITLEDNELCNLVETFPAAHADLCDFKRTLKCAYLFGKIVTLVPAHHPPTQTVIERNRRIGTSLAGVFAFYERVGRREAVRWMDEGYRMLRELDAEYSEWMGVQRSKKRTTIKPGGTVPLLAGHEGGMRVSQARHYFRTIRMLDDSALVSACRAAGYHVEADRVSPHTAVVYFPVESTASRTAKQVSLWEQAAIFTDLQRYWSDNQVSATLMFQPHEALEVRRVLEHYADQWKAVSFLPLEEHGYEQAPYQPIEQATYEHAAAQIQPLRIAANARTHDTDEKFCSGEVCERPAP